MRLCLHTTDTKLINIGLIKKCNTFVKLRYELYAEYETL